MKTAILPLVALTLSVSACSYKSPTDDLNKSLAKTQRDIDALFYGGGQPGKIKVYGVIVNEESGKMLLDERIQISQSGGMGDRGLGRAEVGQKQLPSLSPELQKQSPELVSAFRDLIADNYINLGCENLAEEDTEGLKEKTLLQGGTSIVIGAKKVFICGTFNKSYFLTNIVAEKLILKEANITMTGLAGNLDVLAKSLELQGENSITTLGTQSSFSMEAHSISLSVEKELAGQGILKLISIGGNTIEEKKK